LFLFNFLTTTKNTLLIKIDITFLLNVIRIYKSKLKYIFFIVLFVSCYYYYLQKLIKFREKIFKKKNYH